MKIGFKLFISAIIIALLFVSCTQSRKNIKHQTENTNIKKEHKLVKVKELVLNDSVKRVLRDDAYSATIITNGILSKRLTTLIKKKGPEYAVNFCSDEAMRITDSISNILGLKIRRLAKKYRNPQNETLGKDSLIFKKYILRWLSRKPLKEKIIPDVKGHPVYYNPIKVKHMCLICHGIPGKTMSVKLSDKIKEYYPNDKAINFKAGQLRGMWVITFPQYIIKKK